MIWDRLIGQPHVAAMLREAVRDAENVRNGGASDNSMTHAWLFTGPPGSGRSTAARAFAAALECPDGGCGECHDCRSAFAGEHQDVYVLVPEKLSISVDEARALTRTASMSPVSGRWQVMVVEDADRLNDISGNALLKAVEEPGPRTVWLLCAPTPEDVLVTIRSRMRHVLLATPKPSDVARALAAEGVDAPMAAFAARAAQGHLGRARALAIDEEARNRRQEVLRIPASLRDLGSTYVAAANLLQAATEDAAAIADRLDATEEANLRRAFGEDGETPLPAKVRRVATSAMKDLKDSQKSRRTRLVRDQIDRALIDLLGFYRDVLSLQFSADAEAVNAASDSASEDGPGLINEEMRPILEKIAARSAPVDTLGRIEAIEEARQMMAASVTPTLALEAMTVRLAQPGLAHASRHGA